MTSLLRDDPERRDAFLAALPETQGVYQMKNASGAIVYIGKANSLKARVRQYFQPPPRMDHLMDELVSIDMISCATEREALALESSLIRRLQPRFNIRLKDDSTYLYLELPVPTSSDPLSPDTYPPINLLHRPKKSDGIVLGPYPNAKALKEILKSLSIVLPLRRCNAAHIRLQQPCFYYHLGRCAGPCAGAITPADYRLRQRAFADLLMGKETTLEKYLKAEMLKSSAKEDYEQAATFRDRLTLLGKIHESQNAILLKQRVSEDVIGLAVSNRLALVSILFIRGGVVIGSEEHQLTLGDDYAVQGPGTILDAFLAQYYGPSSFIPRLIIVPELPSSSEVLEQWLSDQKGIPVRIVKGQRATRKAHLDQANRTASVAIEKVKAMRFAEQAAGDKLLTSLQEVLKLSNSPHRIECYDISNTMGQNSVGSMVVVEDGHPAPKQYRHFNIQTVVGPDDFASMQEVLRRRLSHVKVDPGVTTPPTESLERMPDLIIVDGGKGQLSAACEILKEKGLEIDIYGLAKQEEELFAPENPIPIVLPKDSPLLFLVQRLRDEAHRFAITHHRSRRAKAATHSRLSDIAGIGPVRRRALLKRFGDLAGVKSATVEELTGVSGIDRRLALLLHESL